MTTPYLQVDGVRERIDSLGLPIDIAASPDGFGWEIHVVDTAGERVALLLNLSDLSMATDPPDSISKRISDAYTEYRDGLVAVNGLAIWDRVRLAATTWERLTAAALSQGDRRPPKSSFRYGTVQSVEDLGGVDMTAYHVLHDSGPTARWPRWSLEMLCPADDPSKPYAEGHVSAAQGRRRDAHAARAAPKEKTTADRFSDGDSEYRERRKVSVRQTAIRQMTLISPEEPIAAPFQNDLTNEFYDVIQEFEQQLHKLTGINALKGIVLAPETFEALVDLAMEDPDEIEGEQVLVVGTVRVLCGS